MTEEKRRHPRYSVEGMGVNAKTTVSTEVEINDISVGGASITCVRRLSIGSEYMFRFEHREKVLSVKGEVIWAKLTGSRKSDADVVPIYTFGVEFRDAADKAEEIDDFVSDEIGEVRERRLGRVKVKLSVPEKAVVTSLERCTVTEVALGGIRLEMEETPPSEGTMLTLDILLPESGRPLECGGKVVFSEAAAGRPHDHVYSVGIEFTYLHDRDKARLESFLASMPKPS